MNTLGTLAAKVGEVVTKLPEVAPAAAAVVAGEAAPTVAAAAAKGSISLFGLVGGTAGVVGLLATGFSAYKDTIGGGNKPLNSALWNGSTQAIGMGVVLLSVAGGAKIGNPMIRNGLAMGGLGLLVGGVIGAAAGAAQRLLGPTVDRTATNSLLQLPQTFTTELPATPKHLEGMAVAYGEAVTTDKQLVDVGMYIDPATARAVDQHTDGSAPNVGEAIGEAHARAQADDLDRSFAVIQTKDGALWTARLSGDLDQVDGRYFTKDNKFDPNEQPLIGKHQAALQAIAGIESVYVFPKGIDSAEKPQPPGSVPWIEPKLPAAAATPTTGGN